MTEARATPSAKGTASVPADSITALLGVVALVGGVATGLFSDLRTPGKVIGFVAFVGWVLALGIMLWTPQSEDAPWRARGRWISAVAFVLTAVLLVYAFVTGPRLSSRTLVLAPSGVRLIDAACPGVVTGSTVAARIALNQLGEQFIHIELTQADCGQAGKDIRLRSEDLQAVLP